MSSGLHNPPDAAKQVYEWYLKGQIDYCEQYLRLYIAYNAWYAQVTLTTNDRKALGLLKKRFVIWEDYINGNVMRPLKPYMTHIIRTLSDKPLPLHRYWSGLITDHTDWRGLIEYWYQVRCLMVHGAEVSPRHVYLAFETLNIFMTEIVTRMRACFTEGDMQRLQEVSTLAVAEHNETQAERFKRLQKKLQMKYISSPDIWQVDMQYIL